MVFCVDTQLVTRLLPSLSLVFTSFLFLGRGKGREPPLSRQGVSVRVGIYPDLPLGTGWVAVTGLAILRLAVSRTSVCALELSGQVYRTRSTGGLGSTG